MKNNKIEFRSYATDLTVENDSRLICGLAIPVESRSQLLAGEFYEVISREAVDESLIRNNDVRLLIDHEPSRGSLGRSKYGEGTLRLYVDESGLNYEIDLPNTSFGNEVLDAVRRGDIDACSFGFYVGKDEWRKNMDGTYERRILNFEKLIEISLLDVQPAYTATDVTMRSLEEFKRAMEDEEKEKEEEEEVEEKAEDQDEKDTDDDSNDNTGDTTDLTGDDKDTDEELKALNSKLDAIKAEFAELANI